ncbi:MAG TPA: Gfo/Idh/MocA family oxidoreductase [Bryobacteraceae bacterium]|jgi:myo-inositol 2-dehydrogenase/D-chiro-inositol 1-dehydrogenase|nr:Gfo/Idh/MocA family oxidoreductase [Bryobacteraceae bacterium]
MAEALQVAVVGLGRMGFIHALHVHELARDTQTCQLAALAEPDLERARRFLSEIGRDIPVFPSVQALAASRICNAAVVVTPTENHHEHAATLISAGYRVLLEKPLTGTLESDRVFASELDRNYPAALMLAFQRRFDEPLQYAKKLIESGAIGRVFKIFSALEDSNPAPNGYKSGGILPDMSIHNVDEILWFTGRMPTEALAVGSRIYSSALTTCREDFDDALLCLWFDEDLSAQVQVSRNHVSGYRTETILFGEEGQIHVGHFDQKLTEVTVEAYGRRGCSRPLAVKRFSMRQYQRALPEFIDRFGPAYKAELAAFVECCRSGAPFPTTHHDGVRAQEVISAGMRATFGRATAAKLTSRGRSEESTRTEISRA